MYKGKTEVSQQHGDQLDWFFTSNNWSSVYPNTKVTAMAKPIPDHMPCLVSIGSSIPASKIFRLESYWVQQRCFFDVVNTSWSKPSYLHNSAARICQKMRRLTYALKK